MNNSNLVATVATVLTAWGGYGVATDSVPPLPAPVPPQIAQPSPSDRPSLPPPSKPVDPEPPVAKPMNGDIPYPVGRLGLVRSDGETSRWVYLIRAVGAPDTCTRTTQQASIGEEWISAHGPNYRKNVDGTWYPSRSERPTVPMQRNTSTVATNTTRVVNDSRVVYRSNPIVTNSVVSYPTVEYSSQPIEYSTQTVYRTTPNVVCRNGSCRVMQSNARPPLPNGNNVNVGGGSTGNRGNCRRNTRWGTFFRRK